MGPEQRSRNLDGRVQEHLRLIAEREGTAAESLPDLGGTEPVYLQSARERSARSGKSVEQILEDDLAAMRRSTYPGPDCLDQDEVTAYVEGVLPEDRRAHTGTCTPCAALLAATRPAANVFPTIWKLAEEATAIDMRRSQPEEDIRAEPGTLVRAVAAVSRYAGEIALAACLLFGILYLGGWARVGNNDPLDQLKAQIADLRESSSQVPKFTLSSDGKRLAAFSSQSVLLMDLTTKTKAKIPQDHGKPLAGTMFSESGDKLATIHTDGTVTLWDTRQAARLSSFSTANPETASRVLSSYRDWRTLANEAGGGHSGSDDSGSRLQRASHESIRENPTHAAPAANALPK